MSVIWPSLLLPSRWRSTFRGPIRGNSIRIPFLRSRVGWESADCCPGVRESVELEYVEVEDWESLQPGRYGIPEPKGESVALPGSESLVVCPGVAFDARGGRLGMGRGYFDRTFAARGKDRAFLVGVGYGCQIVENLPKQEHDQAMDAVVTEDGLVKLRLGDFSHD